MSFRIQIDGRGSRIASASRKENGYEYDLVAYSAGDSRHWTFDSGLIVVVRSFRVVTLREVGPDAIVFV